MELKLHHVNYSTKDVGVVAEFYQSLFKMKPASGYEDAQITSQGYDRKVAFLTDGTTEFHIAPQDLGVAFRTKQSLNPLDRGHIAFRTDDIEAYKAMLREKNIQFADYGVWAIGGWYQIFLQDPRLSFSQEKTFLSSQRRPYSKERGVRVPLLWFPHWRAWSCRGSIFGRCGSRSR